MVLKLLLIRASLTPADGNFTWPTLALLAACTVGLWLLWYYWLPVQLFLVRTMGLSEEKFEMRGRRLFPFQKRFAFVFACFCTFAVVLGFLSLVSGTKF